MRDNLLAGLAGFEPANAGVMEPRMGFEPINLHQTNDGLLPGIRLFCQLNYPDKSCALPLGDSPIFKALKDCCFTSKQSSL